MNFCRYDKCVNICSLAEWGLHNTDSVTLISALKLTRFNVVFAMHVVCTWLHSGPICVFLVTVVMSDVMGGAWGSGTVPKPNGESCDIVKSRCSARVGCGMALHNFFLGCNDLMYGDTTECSVECTRTLISLMSTEDEIGIGFMECDCEGDESCELRKKRVEVCTTTVLEAIKTLNDSSVVSCTLARWLCEADSSCLTALNYYITYCESLLEGITCTPRCNNSLSILYRQPKAAKLINCSCEGNEEFDCVKIRQNTERLCFNKEVPYHIKGKDSGSSSNCGTKHTNLFYLLWILLTLSSKFVLQ